MPICKTVSFAHITRTSDIILDDCKGKVSCCGLIEALLGIGRSIEVGHVPVISMWPTGSQSRRCKNTGVIFLSSWDMCACI